MSPQQVLDDWQGDDTSREVVSGAIDGLLVPTFRVLLVSDVDAYPFFSRVSRADAREQAARAVLAGNVK